MSRVRMAEVSEETQLQQFREALQDWKRTVLFQGLNNESDEGSIPRRLEEAHQMFFALTQQLNNTQPSEPTKEVETILKPLGAKDSWSESMLDNIRHILFTDLYEYPLTFNTTLIDQFETEEDEDFPSFQ